MAGTKYVAKLNIKGEDYVIQDDELTTKVNGLHLDMSINPETYVITLNLKDNNNTQLGTTQTIDLPLESVVVNGSYDNQTKTITLTLDNGTEVAIPIGDLISGLQTEITSQNKLASDLVDDTSQTNKFVTQNEKDKLAGIEAGAEVNVQSDWNQTTDTADDYIKNKPSLATVATSGSYTDLSDKPTIPIVNNATLLIQQNGTNVESFTANDSTNKIANIIVPTKTSDLTNDGEGNTESVNNQLVPLRFITRLVNNLQYYYTKTEIDALIAPNLRFSIVQTLPTQNISPTTIYLVPNGSSDATNYYDEYLYIATASTPYWELIGSTRIDLTPYQTKTLTTPIVVDGVSQTTVEAVLSALNTLLNNHTHSWSSITNKPTIPTITFRQWSTV